MSIAIGDLITKAELISQALPPAGTVLIPDDGSQARVMADMTQYSDGDTLFIFTDKSGFVDVSEFKVAYVPPVKEADPVEDLAATLQSILLQRDDRQMNENWRRVAVWVLANYSPNSKSPRVVKDGDGDTWNLNDKGSYDISWHEQNDEPSMYSGFSLSELERTQGPITVVTP